MAGGGLKKGRREQRLPGRAVLDSSGSGQDGTPSAGPLYSIDLPPWAANIGSTRSLQFDGVTSRVFVPDSPLLQLTRSLTIEASFKAEPTQPGTPLGMILTRGDTRPFLDAYSFFLNPGNTITFQIENSNSDSVSLAYTVPFDTWTHAAGTIDDTTGEMKLYVNGVLVNSTNTSMRPFAALDPASSPGLGIGCDGTGQ